MVVLAGRDGPGGRGSENILVLVLVALLERSFERVVGEDGAKGSGILSALLSWLSMGRLVFGLVKLVLVGIWVIRGHEGLGAVV